MRRRLLLLLGCAILAPAAARAQDLADYDYTNLGFRGAGLTYGVIWPAKVQSTPTYGVRLDLGYLGPGVRIAPSITYWSSNFRESELARLADRLNRLPTLEEQGVRLTAADLRPMKWRDLALELDAHYVWTTPVGLLTYLGAGVAVHALNGEGEAIQDTFIEDLLDSFSAGLSAIGGVEYPVSDRFRLFGELRLAGLSDVQYAGLRIGGALMASGRTEVSARRGKQ
ncbi:MAG: hypothetical protein IRZ00_06860 [Gemmatimonadetes bacterium]|nr:hypothetical protein [Gemmatimonadota bacterium]